MLGQKRTAQTVAIIGLGDTGVLVASRLVKQFKVIGITTKPNLVSGQELGKRLTDLPWWRVHYNTPLKRFLGLSAVEIIQAKAEWVNPEQRSVRIRLPDGLDSIIHYDYLVIASGTSNGFWRDDSIRSQKEIDDALQETPRALRRQRRSLSWVGVPVVSAVHSTFAVPTRQNK